MATRLDKMVDEYGANHNSKLVLLKRPTINENNEDTGIEEILSSTRHVLLTNSMWTKVEKLSGKIAAVEDKFKDAGDTAKGTHVIEKVLMLETKKGLKMSQKKNWKDGVPQLFGLLWYIYSTNGAVLHDNEAYVDDKFEKFLNQLAEAVKTMLDQTPDALGVSAGSFKGLRSCSRQTFVKINAAVKDMGLSIESPVSKKSDSSDEEDE